jgi:hypothetical protein
MEITIDDLRGSSLELKSKFEKLNLEFSARKASEN